MNSEKRLLILGIGNILMGDEGIGVHAIREISKHPLPDSVTCLDGGTGGFVLLEAMQDADHIILIDGTIDGAETGTIRRLEPRFSSEYPKTLTAHDIGLKDLLDAFHILGQTPSVTLFAVSIPELGSLSLDLCDELTDAIPAIVESVLVELREHYPALPAING